MNPTFHILWVDDSPEWVESVEPQVREHLEALGWDVEIERVDRAEDVGGIGRHVDLLIVDYNLPQDNGDVLISRVRGDGSFAQIVFYSQDHPTKELIGVMGGVWHCAREDAVETIVNVVETSLQRLADLGVVRGMIIASAIDLEVDIELLLASVFGDNGELFRSRILEKQYLDFQKKADLLLGWINDRVKGLSGNEEAQAPWVEVQTIMKRFAEEVVDQRNILAHSRSSDDGERTVLKGVNSRTKEIEFTMEWLQNVRRTFETHRENLRTVGALLG